MIEQTEMVDLNLHVGNKVAKDILGVIGRPLADKDELPDARDLRPFWAKVERAILGLNDNISLRQIGTSGCKNLGPIILGEAAFHAVKDQHFTTWKEFKAAVN